MKNHLVYFIKGIGVGGSMLLPGVSGGTMAILLGIYDKLIYAVSKFPYMGRANTFLIGFFGLGGVIGVLLFASPILSLTMAFEKPMSFLFMGAMIGGIPTLYRKTEFSIKQWKSQHITYFLGGVTLIVMMSIVDAQTMFNIEGDNALDFMILVFAGILCAIALVLPGISLSYILLLFGMYERVIIAISQFDILYLLPIGIGGIFGTLATARILEKAMQHHPTPTYLIILGFLVGSLYEIMPTMPQGSEIIVCLITFSIGILGIYSLQKSIK